MPVVQDITQSAYHVAAATWLRAHGVANPKVNLSQILRIDLEGDGTDEVLLSGSRQASLVTFAQPGDYAFVLLRKVVAGTVETIPIVEEYYPKGCIAECAPVAYRIAAALDINGDGVLEVVVEFSYFEGTGKSVYGVKGKEVVQLMSWRCGV